MTIRHYVLAAMLSAAAISPALATTCHFTIRGKLVLDDETCSVSTRGTAVTIQTDNGASLMVRQSILSASLPLDPSSASHRRKYGAISYGRVIKSNSTDDKTCYFNQTAVLCVDSGGLLDF